MPDVGGSKNGGIKTGRGEISRASEGQPTGHIEPREEVGGIGLQDLRETLNTHRRRDGEYVILIEDGYKSKVVMYRWKS